MPKSDLLDVNAFWESLSPNVREQIDQAERSRARGVAGAGTTAMLTEHGKAKFKMIVKKADPAVANLDPGAHAMNIASIVLGVIEEGLDSSTWPVSAPTQERRARARKSGNHRQRGQKRYPAGYTAGTYHHYGKDSGYLQDSLFKNVKLVQAGDKADVLAGIPKIRQKAAFVIREINPDTHELRGAGAKALARAVKISADRALANSLQKAKKLKDQNRKLREQRRAEIFRLLGSLASGL